ncbi:MAG: GNAT family N-acetyltransferase [Pseudomonadales bacterium]
MNRRQMYQDFAADRGSLALDGFALDALPWVTRYTPLRPDLEGTLVFTRLPSDREDELIQAQIDYFAQRGCDFEWKLYEFDEPADLKRRLAARGFQEDDTEAFMLCAVEPERSAPRMRSGLRIERITDRSGVRDLVRVQELIWEQPFRWLGDILGETLEQRPQQLSLYCAYDDGRAVGTGWTTFLPGSAYAELHGGAVLARYRGRGIYADLFRIRLAEIRRRGYRWAAVDASAMSRPILARLGFQHVCMTVPMRKLW